MAEETAGVPAILPNAGTLASLEQAPDFIAQGDTRGLETIAREDITMPRIGLAQALSPEIQEIDAKFIKDLKQGDMFNTLTKVNYGRGPIEFLVIRADVPRYIQFKPLDQGGGIIDMNVPAGDPRTNFGKNGEKPEATKFQDFIVMLYPQLEFIALSFKSSGLKVARTLNGLISMRMGKPIFAGKYKMVSKNTKNKQNQPFWIFDIENAGWAPTIEVYKMAEQAYEGLKGLKDIKIDRDERHDPIADSTDVGGDASFPHGENLDNARGAM